MPTIYSYIDAHRRAEDEHLQAQQSIQDNAMILQQKMQGIKQQSLENQAVRMYDPNDETSLDRMSSFLAKGGDYKGVMEVSKKKADLQKEKQETAWRKIETDAKEAESVGGLLQSMTDVGSYDRGMARLVSMGIDPKKYGLAGSWEADGQRLPGIARGTISAYKQYELQAKAREDGRKTEHDMDLAKRDAEKIRHDMEMEKASSRREDRLAKAEKDNADLARLKREGAKEQIRLKIQKFSNPDKSAIEAATDLLNSDERFTDLPPEQKKVASRQLAGRASKVVASGISEDNPSWDAKEYDVELERQMDKMVEEGVLTAVKKPNLISRILGAKPTGGFTPRAATGPVTSKLDSATSPDQLKAMVAADPSLRKEAEKVARSKGWIK